jgi:hypothetical protein
MAACLRQAYVACAVMEGDYDRGRKGEEEVEKKGGGGHTENCSCSSLGYCAIGKKKPKTAVLVLRETQLETALEKHNPQGRKQI